MSKKEMMELYGMETVGGWVITNTCWVTVHHIEYGIDDKALISVSTDNGILSTHFLKVETTVGGRAFIRLFGRLYFDEGM